MQLIMNDLICSGQFSAAGRAAQESACFGAHSIKTNT